MFTIFDELEDISMVGLSISDMSHNRIKNNSWDNKPYGCNIVVGREKGYYNYPYRATD